MFWVNDVMFNCMYADNLALMSQLAEEHGSSEDAQRYEDLAGEVESQILSDMWFPNEKDGRGVFYALNKGEPIKEVSISNLFPLVLPRLTEKQLESQLELILTSFNTAYPLPSVATDSPNYDPKNQESERLWRGSTWINTNWYLVERGLRRQAERPDLAHRPELITLCSEIADRVVLASREMVNGSLAEHYNPDTGAGQRLHRSPNFAWSLLAHVMKTSAELEVEKLELVGVEWK
jgi:glycogen debranching enzyme